MPVDVKVPAVGESITEGGIVRWLKESGDTVRRDEMLLELETEKATTEIPAPASGTLNILVAAGKKVLVGSTIASIDESAAPAPPAPAKAKAKEANAKPAAAPSGDG